MVLIQNTTMQHSIMRTKSDSYIDAVCLACHGTATYKARYGL